MFRESRRAFLSYNARLVFQAAKLQALCHFYKGTENGYEQAYFTLNRLLEDGTVPADTADPDELYYWRALAASKIKEHNTQSLIEDALKLFPQGKYMAQLRYLSAYLYYQEGLYQQGEDVFLEIGEH